jgi:protoheme IX farnesyltransferase
MNTLRSQTNKLLSKIQAYWALIKFLQTGLLLLTGLAGFGSARCPVLTWQVTMGLVGSLFLSISGSTMLNMWYDRDIDASMERTCMRPLPSKQVSAVEVFCLGLLFSTCGLAWAFLLSPLYAAVIAAGIFFDVVVYTIWLKRRTAWSILWGGIAGGMPVLAGRALGVGRIDLVGILLALSVVLWIPTHILTISLRHLEDYRKAGIPSFPTSYGLRVTRGVIAFSSLIAAFAMAWAAVEIGMAWGYLGVLGVLAIGMTLLAITSIIRPSSKINFRLFKYASVYMLISMGLVLIESL